MSRSMAASTMSRSMAASTIVLMLFDLGNALACSAGSINATDACTSKGLVQTPPDETVLLQLRMQPAPAPSHQVAEESQFVPQPAKPSHYGYSDQNQKNRHSWEYQPTNWVKRSRAKAHRVIQALTQGGGIKGKTKFMVPEYFMPPAPKDSKAQVPLDANGLTSSGALPAGSTSFPIDVSVSELKGTWGPFFNTHFTVVVDRFTPKEEILHVKGYEENNDCGLADLVLTDTTEYSHDRGTTVEVLQRPWGRVTGLSFDPCDHIEVVPHHKEDDFTGEQLAVELESGVKSDGGWRGCKVKAVQSSDSVNPILRAGAVNLYFEGSISSGSYRRPFYQGKSNPELHDDRITSDDMAYYYNVDEPDEASVEPIIQPLEAWAIQNFYQRGPSDVRAPSDLRAPLDGHVF